MEREWSDASGSERTVQRRFFMAAEILGTLTSISLLTALVVLIARYTAASPVVVLTLSVLGLVGAVVWPRGLEPPKNQHAHTSIAPTAEGSRHSSAAIQGNELAEALRHCRLAFV